MFRSLFTLGKRKKRNRAAGSQGRLRMVTGKSLRIEALECRQLLSVVPQILTIQDAQHYAETGAWASWPDAGSYGGSFRYHASGDGSNTASWNFASLEAGKTYQLYATWPAEPNRATDAPFTILDGQTALATVKLNEKFSPINATLDNHNWESLGTYHTDTGGLTIRLSNNADGYVIASAVCAMEAPATTTPTTLVDNADAGYAETGDWRGWADTASYQGDFRYHAPGSDSKAVFTFDNLDPTKSYRALVTWSAEGNRATNSAFIVQDGSTALATVRLNQQLTPTDVTLDGRTWQSVGVYTPTSGSLAVQLSASDANGYVIADAVRLVEVPPVTTPAAVVDDGDTSYAETGSNWLGWVDSASYQTDFRYHAGGTGQNKVSWSFDALDPDTSYAVWTTWSAEPNRATNSPFSVSDGVAPLAMVRLNQQLAPAGATIDGRAWQSLGTYQAVGGELVVELSDDVNGGYVIADAVRVDAVPTTSGLANLTVDDGRAYSTVELWPAFSDREDADSALTYQIVSNTNSQLISAATIDPATGILTLAYAPQVVGNAQLTVRASDTEGLYVETTLDVTKSDLGSTLYWDPALGSSVWDLCAANWTDIPGGSSDPNHRFVWMGNADDDEAVFGGTASTVPTAATRMEWSGRGRGTRVG
jgi:hypothetical protein